MEDPPDTLDEETPKPRPWPVTVAALATTCLGWIGAQGAYDQLTLSRASVAAPHTYVEALLYAQWVSAQEHKRWVVALEVGRLVLSIFLVIAGSRVLFRVRGAGWLWRQALLGNVVLMAVTASAERMFAGSWTRAFIHAVQSAQIKLPASSRAIPLEESARLAFAGFVFTTWLLDAIMLGFFLFASRARTREVTD